MSGMHEYITVGARRWCLRCNTFQRMVRGAWRDDEEMLNGPAAYERTQLRCPGARDLFAVRAD